MYVLLFFLFIYLFRQCGFGYFSRHEVSSLLIIYYIVTKRSNKESKNILKVETSRLSRLDLSSEQIKQAQVK